MWCPECNRESPCDCYEPPKKKFVPRDYEKEHKEYLEYRKSESELYQLKKERYEGAK